MHVKLLIAWTLASMSAFCLNAAQAGEDFQRGVTLVNEKRFDDATKALKKAVSVEPKNCNALYYLALSQHHQGKTAEAMANYQAILKKFPGTHAASLAMQAVSSMRNPAAYQRPANSTVHDAVKTYSSGSKTGVNLPEQATIFFERGDDKLIVDGYINNRPLKMVFDTGATGVVVGKNQLEEIGIKPPDNDASGQSGGSSNTALQPYWMINADVKVGTILRQNFPVKVLAFNSSSPLLGQSFIQDFDYSIDRDAGAIRLKRKGLRAGGLSAHGGYSVPFRWEGPKMVVNVEVNGRPYPMYFDTGNSASAVSFGMNDLKVLNITPEDSETVSTGGVAGSGHGLKFKVRRLKLGPIEKYDIAVIANYQSDGRPLVGQQLYEGFEYSVDNDAMMIRFIRR